MILACPLFSVRHLAIGAAMSFAVLLCAPSVGAQASRVGTVIEGTVRDGSGAAVPGSKLTVRNTFTSQSRIVTTDEQGFFRAEQLAAGTYELNMQQTDFAPYRHAGVETRLGETVHIDIVLVPASASEQVTVSAQTSAIDLSQTSVVFSVGLEKIEELPVRSRNYLDF